MLPASAKPSSSGNSSTFSTAVVRVVIVTVASVVITTGIVVFGSSANRGVKFLRLYASVAFAVPVSRVTGFSVARLLPF